MRFDYYDIRPCIELPEIVRGVEDLEITSYVDKAEFYAEEKRLDDASIPYDSFWTLYGRHDAGDGETMLATALGDFITEADAYEVLDAILAPMQAALDLIGDDSDKARAILQDALTLSTQRSAF